MVTGQQQVSLGIGYQEKHHTGIRLASDWHQTGITLASHWHHTGITLASDWHQTGITLASDWHQTGIRLEQVVLYSQVFPLVDLNLAGQGASEFGTGVHGRGLWLLQRDGKTGRRGWVEREEGGGGECHEEVSIIIQT